MLRFFGWLLIAASFFLLPVGLSVVLDTEGRIVVSVTLWRIVVLQRRIAVRHPEAGKWTLCFFRGDGSCAGERVVFPPEKKKKRDMLRIMHFLSEAYRWEEVRVDGTVASCDAGKTAIWYGILCAALGGFDAAVGNRSRIRQYSIMPSFSQKKTQFLFYGMFFTFPGKLIVAAIRTGKANKTVPLPITAADAAR